MALNEITAIEQVGFPILTILIFLPVALLVALVFIRDERLAYRVGLGGATVELALAFFLAYAFRTGTSDMQFVESLGSIPGIGVGYHLGVDGVSVLFVPVTALLTALVILYAEYSVRSDARHYLIATLGLEATMMGAFLSLDLLMFWAFFVLELIPAYFLITRWGTGERRREAALSYIHFMLTGSALMLVGFVLLAVNASFAGGGGLTFDFMELLGVSVPASMQTIIFFFLFIGFAVKAPIFPLHTWMPKVLEEGPIVGMSVFLVGIKLGTYGMLRFMIPLLPEASVRWLWVMAILGAVSIVYGAMIALIQTNLRRLLAFASVSHMGVVLLSMFTLNIYGLEGGLLQMINFGIAGAGLFFVAGFISSRIGPPDLSSLGGVASTAPWLTVAFLVIALATIGLPGTNGFNGEHLVLIGAFEVHWLLALAAGTGIVLTAAYFLWFFQRGFLGEVNERTASKMKDLRSREMIIALVLGAMIFWIGLATTPFVQRMRPSLEALEARSLRSGESGAASLRDASGVGSREIHGGEAFAEIAAVRVHREFVERGGGSERAEKVETIPTPGISDWKERP
ncbi:MAG: NADH-quinone oxidoreductase subunit M [Rubrobacter sp.]|nr:NADH-quinone oxidoreductase subunit M [Rubrobacter sp.]